MKLSQLGESINEGGRGFKIWFTDFTLVYSPIFIVIGLILTGIDLFLNLGIGDSLWFKIPWSLAQLFAVDGLWFAVWNRILTDEYKRQYWAYHTFLIFFGITMTGIAITANYIIFTQAYLGLKNSVQAMNLLGIPVSSFLLVRSILLMATATLAIVLDKVMRTKKQFRASTPKKQVHVPGEQGVSINEEKAPVLALPSPKPAGYKEQIRGYIEQFNAEGKPYTNQELADLVGCKLQTVKVYAPQIKRELGI